MPDQDGLRFLFDIQDKISAKLAKIEAKAKSSAAKIDKAFTRASKSQEANSARAVAAEQRRAAAAEKAHQKALKRIERESAAFKRSMTRLASAATVAFAAVSGKALTMAAGYDAAMRSVQAKTGATGETLDRLSEQAREMGRTTVHSATEAARGQAFLAQAGFEAHEILEALPATLALATAGELDLASAADIASNVLSGFRLETEQTGRVTDVLAAIAAKTNTSVSQMGVALAKAAPSAAAAGWSLEQTAAAIGRLSDAGIQGEEAGTVLKTMLARLAAPTGKLEELMTKTGISITDTTGQMLPLNDIIAQLAPHADNTGLMFELLGTRGANAGLILGSLADDDLANLTAELENSEGAAQKMADTMSGGLWGSIKSIQSIVESAYISFGERLAPVVGKTARLFGTLPSPIQEVVVVVGSLAGAMGGLMLIAPQSFGAIVQFPGKLLKLGKVLKSTTLAQRALNLAMRLNPIGLVITAVAALAAGIYLLWKRYNKLEKTFDAAASSTEDLTDRYDDLTEKIAAAEAQIELVRKGAVRSHPIYAKTLRALVAERKELKRHIQQRKRAAKTSKLVSEMLTEILKAQEKATEATDRATDAAEEAAEAVEKEAEAVQDLADSWTGATIKSGRFLRAFKKLTPEQKKNDRIMDQVIDTYNSMRKILGPFDDELEAIWQTTERLNPEIARLAKEQEEAAEAAEALQKTVDKLNASGIDLAQNALAKWFEQQEKVRKEAEVLNERLEAQRRRLLGLPTDAAIQSFEELTRTWEGMNEAEKAVATDKYRDALRDAAEAGHDLSEAQREMTSTSGGFFTSLKSGFEDMLGGITGGKGIAGMLEGIGAGITQGIGNIISGGLASLANLALKGIVSLGKKIWGWMKSLFGGPSAAELAGRETAAGFRQGLMEGLSAEQLAEAERARGTGFNKFWDAVTKIAIRDALIASGATIEIANQTADAMFLALWRAEAEGPEAVARVMAQMQAILEAGGAAVEEVNAIVEAAAEAAARRTALRQTAELAALKDTHTQMLALINEEQTAAMALLNERADAEMKSLEETNAARLSALADAQATQLSDMKAAQQRELDELASARNAQLSVVEAAIQRELEDERIAAQLKIDIEKAGGNKKAKIAAKARAKEGFARLAERDKLDKLMAKAEKRVRARYQDELDVITDHWDEKETILTSQHNDELAALDLFHTNEMDAVKEVNAEDVRLLEAHHAGILELEQAYWDDLIADQTIHFDEKLAALKLAHAEELGETIHHVEAINEETLQLRDRTVTIRTVHVEEYRTVIPAPVPKVEAAVEDTRRIIPNDDDYEDDFFGEEYRQHGGPVRAGRSYIVGERGPEMFIPSGSGRIDPNGGGGGTVDPRILARAIKDALDGSAVEVDGRKFGRLAVRHQPIAAAELGGRR